jgi:hypothetical protein
MREEYQESIIYEQARNNKQPIPNLKIPLTKYETKSQKSGINTERSEVPSN